MISKTQITHPSKNLVRIFHLKSFEIYLHYVTIRKKSVEIEVAHTRKKLNQIIKPVIQKILGGIKTHYETILIGMDQIKMDIWEIQNAGSLSKI